MSLSEPSTSAPVPAHHVFLYELPKHKVGTKVRFLCCVLEYDRAHGKLHVEHAYPAESPYTPTAVVDVNMVLETTKPHELYAKGAWLNILGYLQEGPGGKSRRRSSSGIKRAQPVVPLVQAVLMWNAGAIKVNEYEAIMEKQREALKNAKQVAQKYQ